MDGMLIKKVTQTFLMPESEYIQCVRVGGYKFMMMENIILKNC